ncbi:hypothetical protein JMI89_01770 [Frischella sp. Ac48]|uniref:hypothetical protein n=1 Tax=Frischella sp. Ac48 TaxID=2804531 RepID=UPI001C7DC275|nr:hypothetical protein [Frischella sp. Ac48]MBX4132360.1 hypothetical protein [Frischella sp. Ac48]
MKKIGITKFCELMVESANNATPFILFTVASIVLYDKKPIYDTAITLIGTNIFLWCVWSVPTIKKIILEDDDKITRAVVFISILSIIFLALIATISLS